MEKIEKTILLGSTGQIGSNLKKKLLLTSKNGEFIVLINFLP